MKKPLSQIALFDFVAEAEQPAAEPVRKELSTHPSAGVGVRLKSMKKSEATQTPEAKMPEEAISNASIPEEALAEPVVIEEPIFAAAAIDTAISVALPALTPVKSTRGRKSLKQSSAEADLIDIPDDETLFLKQYYTMGEVAGMFRVNQSLLRFWETEFSILQPKKNKKGDRHFRPVDIKNLHLIYHLLRQRKYTIEGAKDFLKKNKKAEERFEAIKRLTQVKSFLLEWKAQL
jgi:DNA-binding transcriptional MerR regulator